MALGLVRRPMRISISLKLFLSFSNISPIMLHHAMNFSLVRDNCSLLVSSSHPSSNFCSSRPVSVKSFLMYTRFLLLVTSASSSVLPRMCMVSSNDAESSAAFSLMSTHPLIVSSIYTSALQSSSGTSIKRGGCLRKRNAFVQKLQIWYSHLDWGG